MDTHLFIESVFANHTADFAASGHFQSLEKGEAPAAAYDEFIANLCRMHLKSPQILAFLFSVAPPAAIENIRHNLFEELGLEETEISHPALLLEVAAAAGFDGPARAKLENAAQEELRRIVSDPILFGTLREVGLSVLLETTAFEWMLSRLAGRMERFLRDHRRMLSKNLRWFHHHSEVDIRHAEEGLQSIADYIEFYEFEPADVEIIVDVTFRENVFIRRYFGELALAKQMGVFV